MKKLTLSMLVVFFLAAPSWAARFVEICQDENSSVLIDTDSIVSRGDHLVVWVKINFSEHETSTPQVLILYALNPKQKQSQDLSMHFYDKNGSLVNSYSYTFSPSRYKEVIPETRGEDIYDFTMAYYQASSPSSPYPPNLAEDIRNMSPEQLQQLIGAAKVIACNNYLRISVNDFDLTDPAHAFAFRTALEAIIIRAEEIRREREAAGN